MRYLGAYVSSAGGLFKIIDRGEELGVNTVMTHPAAPQRWNSQPFKDEVIEKYLERKALGTSIEKTYFHGIYLINLANPDSQKFHLSKLSVVNHLNLLNKINGDGVIFHTGSFKDYADIDLDKGYERVIYGLNWIFENLETMDVMKNASESGHNRLMLECAAGSGKVIGSRVEELARIYEGVKDEFKPYLGFCLDTQHMFASGYDLINKLEQTVQHIDQVLGTNKIKAIHFNDSKTDLASNKDRHENLSEGKIGESSMIQFLNHPKLKNIPFILETPGLGELKTAKLQVDTLKNWAN